MSKGSPIAAVRGATWRVVAAVLLLGFAMPVALAQQHRQTRPDTNIHVVHFPRMLPAKGRSILPGGPNVVGRNAIGLPVVRHDAVPGAPSESHVAVRTPAPQSLGGSGLAISGAGTAPVRAPGTQPLVLSHSTIGGAAFTRPGTALLPLGGPAKPGATSINGTSIRPKH